MITVKATITGTVRYYKCDNIAAAEALIHALGLARIEADFL